MPFVLDVTKVANYRDLCYVTDEKGETHLNHKTDILKWATMMIGMHQITEENTLEFYMRVQMFERVIGKLSTNEKIEITLEDVREHIGLHTNTATTNMTPAQFYKKILKLFQEEVKRNPDRDPIPSVRNALKIEGVLLENLNGVWDSNAVEKAE